MKAIVAHTSGGPEVLRLEKVATPAPGAGELLIKVAAAGVNYADLLSTRGMAFGPHAGGFPITPGFEVAGTVVAVGANVSGFAEGARVAAVVESGGYAEYAVAPAERVFPLPDDLDFATALGFLIQGLTAYGLLHDAARLQPGESVLVQAAAGGVGSLAVQLARLLGAQPVIGTASTDRKRELVLSLGAHSAIDYTRPDWTQQVLAATNGVGVDVVLESVGGQVGAQVYGAIAPLGRLLVFGGASGQPMPWPDMQLFNVKGLTISGFGGPWLRPGRAAAAWQALIDAVRADRLKVVIGEQFPLADAAVALHALAGRETVGKVVLKT
jgi:NADPH:quinone reductase